MDSAALLVRQSVKYFTGTNQECSLRDCQRALARFGNIELAAAYLAGQYEATRGSDRERVG